MRTYKEHVKELEMIAKAVVGEEEIEKALLVDDKRPDVVALPHFVLEFLARGYRVLLKKKLISGNPKLMDNYTLIVFIDPSNTYFIPTLLENPIWLNHGGFKPYRLYDKRSGKIVFRRKLMHILATRLELPWRCVYCGRCQMMTFEDVLRRKNCLWCQPHHLEKYGRGNWVLDTGGIRNE